MQISVVIPTHDRRAILLRALQALSRQTFDPSGFEVIVVADGCGDGTEEMVRRHEAPFALQLVSQPASGPGAARNAGARRASGEVILFLDDDIEATAGLVAAHVAAHAVATDVVAIGYVPPVLRTQRRYFRALMRISWETMVQHLRHADHRFSYQDFFSGNSSMRAALFDEVGGFDPTFRVHEDFELGARLVESGARFTFLPEAIGWHNETTDAARVQARKYEEGRADVQLGRRHPALKPTLPLFPLLARRRHTILRRCVFAAPRLSGIALYLLSGLLGPAEGIGMRRTWHQLIRLLLMMHYWRGVAVELGSWSAFGSFRRDIPPRPDPEEIQIDLRGGLAAAELEIERTQPAAIQLSFGEFIIGDIRTPPGVERLRGRHLRPLLRRDHMESIATAFAAQPPGTTFRPTISRDEIIHSPLPGE